MLPKPYFLAQGGSACDRGNLNMNYGKMAEADGQVSFLALSGGAVSQWDCNSSPCSTFITGFC